MQDGANDLNIYGGDWWMANQAMERSLGQADALSELARAVELMDDYDEWASGVDDFAPVKIDHDVSALVCDPADPERGLVTADGAAVTYTCRIDLLAVDAADEYWVVCHRLGEDWRQLEENVLDEQATAACWAAAGSVARTVTARSSGSLLTTRASRMTGSGQRSPRASTTASWIAGGPKSRSSAREFTCIPASP